MSDEKASEQVVALVAGLEEEVERLEEQNRKLWALLNREREEHRGRKVGLGWSAVLYRDGLPSVQVMSNQHDGALMELLRKAGSAGTNRGFVGRLMRTWGVTLDDLLEAHPALRPKPEPMTVAKVCRMAREAGIDIGDVVKRAMSEAYNDGAEAGR